ncbi:MAG: hypothetical protein A2Y64_02065 [Candidatus Coatesbacteria bacterium RBG_13_66_14]|uniref:Quinohemoprotein amine dehydrogenase alpha subunit haem binding domain-containing protein n=1 Tax=Candidatus Coatesbacteria bacterium RBG_13_66_14 TaxID=1817816 RepID=A0A1F5FGY0_9BACT|nr:MAG: hypothetical protein A2Y64_02065 [Candidatus Coatesbacteria bacterium RBG_13_66_14]
MKTNLLVLFLMILPSLLIFSACGGEADKAAPDGSESPSGGTVAGEAPPTGERALLEERCTACHSLDKVYAEKRDEAGWDAVLEEMVSYGAKLDSAERTRLVAYLVSL